MEYNPNCYTTKKRCTDDILCRASSLYIFVYIVI